LAGRSIEKMPGIAKRLCCLVTEIQIDLVQAEITACIGISLIASNVIIFKTVATLKFSFLGQSDPLEAKRGP
jgi:hypothetical protein